MDGTALIFCEGAFGLPEGKTANGLVRFGSRYEILGVIDSRHAGRDAGEVVEGVAGRIPVFGDLSQAVEALPDRPDYLVIGLNPPDGRLDPRFRRTIVDALRRGISVDSALQPYLQEDAEFPGLAQQSSARIRSVGYPKTLSQLRQFSGEIDAVSGKRVAVVGTWSIVGKRTTTVRLTREIGRLGVRAEMIGTGETSWFQGVRSTVILDSILSRYVAGELERTIVEACRNYDAEVCVLEGQGSILNPENPTGAAILTTGRPDTIVMQHAPIHPSLPADDRFGLKTLDRHLRAAELLSNSSVIAITISHEGGQPDEMHEAAEVFRKTFGLYVCDVLLDGAETLASLTIGTLGLRAATSAR